MDKIQIKDLDSAVPVAEDYLVFQKATGGQEVYKSPKSEIEGEDAFVYIAYASDDSGTDFTLVFNPALNYIAILSTNTEIASPVVGDFAGLWKNYKGATGDTGLTGAYIYRTVTIPDNSVGLDGDWAFGTTSESLVYYKTAGVWELVNSNKGAIGDTGVGIASVTLTGTAGLVDTYTITYDDASTSTFDVTNGEKGDTGDAGISFLWMGAYSAITAYLPNSVVSYNGSSYICTLATTGNLPTDAAYWSLMALKGNDGEGSGDVNGPATNTDNYIPQWDGANSKTLKDGLAVPAGGLAGLTALGAKEDSSNKSTNVVTDGASDTKYPSVKAIKDYADGLVSGLLDYRGAYDASVNTFPASGGSGSAGAVMKGDMWIISVAGTLGGAAVQIGDSVISNVDTPGQTAGNWNILNSNITYVPEDVANKKTTMSGNTSSDTFYLTAKAIYDWGVGLFQTLGNLRTTFQATPDDTHYISEKLAKDSLNAKQDTLVSGTNIKTVNGGSILGAGDITISGGKTYGSTTSSATPTINTDLYDRFELTAQATNITSFTTNLTGTPVKGDKLNIKITPAVGSPSFINQASGYSRSSNSVACNKPTNTADGDIMIACVQSLDYVVNSVPAGWTLFGTVATPLFGRLYWKVASSEGASYTWGFGGAGNVMITILTYRGGFNPASPIDVLSNTGYTTSNTIVRAASMTTAKANELVIFFGFGSTDNAYQNQYTVPSGFTQRWQDTNWNHSYVVGVAGEKTFAASGATGNMDGAVTQNVAVKHAFAFAFNPFAVAVTYGASFSNVDYTAPTSIGGTVSLDFVWNGTTWETHGKSEFLTGTAAPTTVPTKIGMFFIDTTNSKLYVSKNITASTDWFILN